jgi:L-asparagine transporter-like permease
MFSVFLFLPFSAPQILFSALRQFVANVLLFIYCSILVLLMRFQRPSMSSNHTPYAMIGISLLCVSAISNISTVTILILDHACISYASLSQPTLKEALHKACSQYNNSHSHDAVTKQFTVTSRQYSISQFTEFILRYRLS